MKKQSPGVPKGAFPPPPTLNKQFSAIQNLSSTTVSVNVGKDKTVTHILLTLAVLDNFF